MDGTTLFGLVAVTLMVAFYEVEGRAAAFTLLFAGACVLGSAYGFLSGAWPFGLVEAVWAGIAFQRWRKRVAAGSP